MKKNLMFLGRGSICSVMFYALLFILGLSFSASATPISATSYDMRNGDYSTPGTSLMDDTYSVATNRTTPYAQLIGGLGELTDGVAATSNWEVPGPYVGWSQWYNPNPTITFHFASTVIIDDIQISMNTGYNASSVTFAMGGVSTNRSVSGDLSGGANTWYDFQSLSLTGNTLVMTLNDRVPDQIARDWILISEVKFDGSQVNAVPEPATMLLFGTGLAGLAAARRRKKAR